MGAGSCAVESCPEVPPSLWLELASAAAPVDDAANEELVAYLAGITRRPRRDVRILSGQKSRDERVAIDGLAAPELNAYLSAILPQ